MKTYEIVKLNDEKKKSFDNIFDSKFKILEKRKEVINQLDLCLLLHTIIFCIIIILQYNVYYRYHIHDSLQNYFALEAQELPLIDVIKTPEEIFLNLLASLKKNSFVFLDSKFEIISNIRITQRINLISNDDLNEYINIPNNIKIKLMTNKLTNIDPFSSFNPEIETKEILKNKFNYDIEKSKIFFFR